MDWGMSEGKKPSGWAMNKRSKRANLTQDYVIECLKWEAEGQGGYHAGLTNTLN